MSRRFVSEHRGEFPVTRLCELVGVPRSSFYEWDNRPLSDHYLDDVDLKKIGAFESALLDYMANSQSGLLSTLDGGDWNDEVEAQLTDAVKEFKSTGTW